MQFAICDEYISSASSPGAVLSEELLAHANVLIRLVVQLGGLLLRLRHAGHLQVLGAHVHEDTVARLGGVVAAYSLGGVEADVGLDARVDALVLGEVRLREEVLVAVGKAAGKGPWRLVPGNVLVQLGLVGKGALAVLPRAGVRQVDEVIVAHGVEAAAGT